MKVPRPRMKLLNLHPRLRPNLKALGKTLARIGRGKSKGVVHFAFVNDAKIAELSGRFRGVHRPTDVLAFSYDCDLLGEVAVSLDTARRQAKERGMPFERELALLCVHGLLHIAGFDDESYKDWCDMRTGEFETLMRILN